MSPSVSLVWGGSGGGARETLSEAPTPGRPRRTSTQTSLSPPGVSSRSSPSPLIRRTVLSVVGLEGEGEGCGGYRKGRVVLEGGEWGEIG